MKTLLLAFLLCALTFNCQSQKNISKANKNYFIGNWILKERNYMDGNSKKSYPLQECEKKYSLVFEKSNNNIVLTKNYAAGKDCKLKSNSGKISIIIGESSFSYLDLDLKRTEQYKILSKNKFSILYSEILDGKVREIEDLYERR